MPAKTASEIDAGAADWAARHDRGPLSPEDTQQFRDWLDGDVRCPGAYGRMRALALGPGFEDDDVNAGQCKIHRQRRADRPGADDDHLRIR